MIDKRLFDYLYEQLHNFPQPAAYGHKVDGQWHYYSTTEIVDLVNKTSLGLLKLGVQPGDKIGTVVYRCSPQWMVLDFAIQQVGALNVPMYPTISPREYAYILQEATVKYCVVGDGDLFDKVSAAKGTCPEMREIFTFDNHPTARRWDVLLTEGDLSEVERVKATITPDDIATIIYTSGTTGNPKGVVLTHRNIAYNVETMRQFIPLSPGERGLSFLPVSHVFERAVVYAYTAYGASITFTGTDNLGGETGDLKTLKPHFFAAVPRLLEKVYDKIYHKGSELTGIKRALFFWAMELSEEWDFDQQRSLWKRIQWFFADKLIFSKWREALGGNVKGILTGASACPIRVMRAFNAAGIAIREGYGMTEAAPGISFNRYTPYGAKLGCVGPILDGTEIRIVPDETSKPGEGEILVKGPGVMQGYYLQPEKTEEVIRMIDGERWLVTGDIGTMVEGKKGVKFLKITDRKKELLKTSLGKYVAPAPIESAFKEHRLVEQIMVVGENLKFVSALIVPATDGLKEWCEKHQLAWTSLEDMIKDPKVMGRYQMLAERINPNFSHSEQVKKITLLPNQWEPVKSDGSDAELTPTLKLKRRVILDKFKKEIDQMYA